MNKRDAMQLQIDDKIVLKHGLGDGPITEVILEYSEGCGHPEDCRFPMIQYRQEYTVTSLTSYRWCTYRIVKHVNYRPRSVT